MTAGTSNGRVGEGWWNGERLQALRPQWQARVKRLTTVEVGLSALIMLTWAVLGSLSGWELLVIFVVPGLCLHLAAAETGSHVLMWLATGYVLLLMLWPGAFSLGELRPMSLAGGSLSAIVHNELLRLHHARRRNAKIDGEVYTASAIGLGALALFSMVGVGLAAMAQNHSGRSWLWMVAASGALLATAVLLTVLPKRLVPKGASQSWQPGERIPPERLGQFDVD